MGATNVLMAPMSGVESRAVGGVRIDVVPIGSGGVKRVIYEPGFRWSIHMKPVVGTDRCLHAHVGFLAAGDRIARVRFDRQQFLHIPRRYSAHRRPRNRNASGGLEKP